MDLSVRGKVERISEVRGRPETSLDKAIVSPGISLFLLSTATSV